MKKILSLAMIAALCASFTAPITAAVDENQINCAEQGGETCKVDKDNADTTIPVSGTIGVQSGATDKWIDITVPSKVAWVSKAKPDSADSGKITSANYEIINNKARTNVKVAFKSFKETNTISDAEFNKNKLNLFFTGDLGMTGSTDLSKGTAPEVVYGSFLTSKKVWTFGFGGAYTGTALYDKEFIPTYTMTLNFKLYSVDGE